MNLKSVTANIIVSDVARTVDWYREALGFEFTLGVIEGTQDPAFEATGQPLGFAASSCDSSTGRVPDTETTASSDRCHKSRYPVSATETLNFRRMRSLMDLTTMRFIFNDCASGK